MIRARKNRILTSNTATFTFDFLSFDLVRKISNCLSLSLSKAVYLSYIVVSFEQWRRARDYRIFVITKKRRPINFN